MLRTAQTPPDRSPIVLSEPDFVVVAGDGVRLAKIKGTVFLFVPKRQNLFKVNPATEQLWPLIELGVGVRDLGAEASLIGCDSGALLEDLKAIDAIEYVSVGTAPVPIESRTAIMICGVVMGIHFAGDRAHNMLRGLFSHLETQAPPEEHIVVTERTDGIGIARLGEQAHEFTWTEAGPALKSAITELALRATEGMALHVATLRRDDEALLLIGPPGAGKSTLSVALAANGFDLQGDDLAALQPDGTVRAMPLPTTLKDGAWPVLSHLLPNLREGSSFVRHDQQCVQYLPLVSSPDPEPLRVRCAVSLCRDETKTPELELLDEEQFIASIVEGGWSGDQCMSPDDFEAVAACADGLDFFRLTYSDLDTAVARIRELWEVSRSGEEAKKC